MCAYKTIEELIKAIEGVMNPISPIPPIMKRAGVLRGFNFRRDDAQEGEKNRVLTVADAIQLATCLYVKENFGISDIEFHTFDDGKGRNYEVTLDDKVVSLLRFEEYAGQHRHNTDIDAVCRLKRIKPQLAQASLA